MPDSCEELVAFYRLDIIKRRKEGLFMGDNTITVKVHDLLKRIEEIKKDKMDYVEISILKPDDNEPYTCLSFEAFSREEPDIGYDYDAVEAVTSDELDSVYG
jgi:hypothetical protein